MTTYVKVHTGTLKIEATVNASAAPTANADKPWVWREYVNIVPAHYDGRIHTLTKNTPTLSSTTLTENYTVTLKALATVKTDARRLVRATGEAKREKMDTNGALKAGVIFGILEAYRWDAMTAAERTATNLPILETVRVARGLSTLVGARNYVMTADLVIHNDIAAAFKPEETGVKSINDAANQTAVAAAIDALDWSV